MIPAYFTGKPKSKELEHDCVCITHNKNSTYIKQNESSRVVVDRLSYR